MASKTQSSSKELTHVEHMERLFEYIAYGSLLLDFGIAVVTLVSANLSATSVSSLQMLLNYGITAVLIVSAVLFVAIRIMVHYEKILDHLARLGLRRRGQKKL